MNPLVPGSSPGGPTMNHYANSRVGIFLSVALSNAYEGSCFGQLE